MTLLVIEAPWSPVKNFLKFMTFAQSMIMPLAALSHSFIPLDYKLRRTSRAVKIYFPTRTSWQGIKSGSSWVFIPNDHLRTHAVRYFLYLKNGGAEDRAVRGQVFDFVLSGSRAQFELILARIEGTRLSIIDLPIIMGTRWGTPNKDNKLMTYLIWKECFVWIN